MKTLLLFFFVLVSLCLNAQSFKRIIGNGNATYARDIIQLADTNYLITGCSSGYGDYTANAFLMKVDRNGNFLWSKTYGGSNADWAMHLVENPDGSITFAGYTNSIGNGGYDIWLVNTDASGNLNWEKTFGGSDWDFAQSIIRSNDGGYLITGKTYSYGNGGTDAFILKCNAAGDSLWMQTYGGAANDEGMDIVQSNTGSIYVTGSTQSPPANGTDAWFFKTDANGVFAWEKNYGGNGTDLAESLVLSEVYPNKIILGANTDSLTTQGTQQWCIETDTNGTVYCTMDFGGSLTESTHDIAERHTGITLPVGATYSYGTGGGDFIVYYNNNCSWAGGESLGSSEREEAYAVTTTLDSGYIMVGESVYGPGLMNIFLVKFGNDLALPPPATTYFDINAIEENEEPKIALEIYPNPSQGIVNIRCKDTQEFLQSVELIDLSGRVIASVICFGNTLQWDVSQNANGMYLMRMVMVSGKVAYESLIIKGER